MALPIGWRVVRKCCQCACSSLPLQNIDAIQLPSNRRAIESCTNGLAQDSQSTIRFAQKAVANVDINVHTSSASSPNKGGACKTCGSEFVGGIELEPAILSSCSFGCMVLGIGGCVALWCIPSNAHSSNNVQAIHEQLNAMLVMIISSFGRGCGVRVAVQLFSMVGNVQHLLQNSTQQQFL